MKKIRAFTLIEIMVALSILTLVGLAAVSGLHHMVRARERQMEHQERYIALTRVYSMFSQDLFYAIMSDAEGDEHGFSIEKQGIRFSRTMRNEQGQYEPVKLEYQFSDHGIKRIAFKHEAVLLSGVHDFRVFILTKSQSWQPIENYVQDHHLPLAVRCVFNDEQIGELTWSYALPH